MRLDSRRFLLTFASVEAFDQEFKANLLKGRALIPGEVAAADRSPCVVVVTHPMSGAQVELAGEVVFCGDGPAAGVGVDLVDPELAAMLARLSFASSAEPVVEPDPSPEQSVSSAEPEAERHENLHERVRRLGPAQRERLARSGSLPERTALERAFGAAVWEGLLENAQLSGGEVARIAKNGAAPVGILAHITSNAGWLSKGEVRRALLSNPRLPIAQAERVLRAAPAMELRLVPTQTAYSGPIRELARRLLQR